MASPLESEVGNYRVEVHGEHVRILARKSDSPYFVPQSILVESINDLRDLYIAIGLVLNEYHNRENDGRND